MEKCKDIMTKNPVCCEPNDSIVQAAQLMEQNDVGTVLVCQNHANRRLGGILTDRDIAIKVVAKGQDPQKTKAEQVMSRNLVCCQEDDTIEECINLMEEHQVRRIPIVNKNNQFVGIISQGDVAVRSHEPAEKKAEVVQEVSRGVTH